MSDSAEKGLPRCAFCQIIAGDLPAKFILREKRVVAFYPLDPVTEGHVLVVPVMHVNNFLHNPAVTAEVAGVAARLAARLAPTWRGGTYANLITSAGTFATQSVMHLHFHIVPRAKDDGLPLPWTPQRTTFIASDEHSSAGTGHDWMTDAEQQAAYRERKGLNPTERTEGDG